MCPKQLLISFYTHQIIAPKNKKQDLFLKCTVYAYILDFIVSVWTYYTHVLPKSHITYVIYAA